MESESTAHTINNKFIGIIVHHLSNGTTFAPDTLPRKIPSRIFREQTPNICS